MAQTNPFETAFKDASKIGEAVFNPVKTIGSMKQDKEG